MTEVAWEPGLTEPPAVGMWVRALQPDDAFVTEGLAGLIVGSWNNTPVVLWDNGTRSAYPVKHMARVNKPRARSYYTTQPSTCWVPNPGDGTDEGVSDEWKWIRGRSA